MKTSAKGIVAAAIACVLSAGTLAGTALASPVTRFIEVGEAGDVAEVGGVGKLFINAGPHTSIKDEVDEPAEPQGPSRFIQVDIDDATIGHFPRL